MELLYNVLIGLAVFYAAGSFTSVLVITFLSDKVFENFDSLEFKALFAIIVFVFWLPILLVFIRDESVQLKDRDG